MKGIRGRLHSVETFGAVDGPGIRYVAFLQGCPLRCLYCHNPDTWRCGRGLETDSARLVEEILSYRNFYRNGGVTLSGGEPLVQSEFCEDILRRLREEGLHTALDTSGVIPLEKAKASLDRADLILLDIKSLDNAVCQELTGMGNENTLKTLQYLHEVKKPVWLRHVLVPGYTLDTAKLEKLAVFLEAYRETIELVDLLPFHKMGEYKWEEMDVAYKLYDTPTPAKEEVAVARKIFTQRGFRLRGEETGRQYKI